MRRIVALCLALAVSASVAPRAEADAANDVVVSVGESKITVAEVERRLRAVPAFQLQEYGSNPKEIRRNFVERVLVPELLLSEEAKRRGVDKHPAVADRVRAVLVQALDSELRSATTTISPDEIRVYYDANRHRFNTPRRIKIWRILVKDEATAKKILTEVKGDDVDSTLRWNRAARESLDEATKLRDGDLGFVSPDGQTEMPQVRVNPELFAAADKVKDGELVKEPVKEGDKFAVIWRRGSLEATVRTLEQEAPSIRQIVSRQKLADAMKDAADKLRNELVKNVSYELLSYVAVDSNGDVGSRQRPGVLSREHARGNPAPKSEQGSR